MPMRHHPDHASDLIAAPLGELLERACAVRGHRPITYSPKVFIPLTKLCRDVCDYCTFARPPRRGNSAPTMTDEEVLASPARAPRPGCHEALFTLGDKPELRYRVAREELASLRLRHDPGVPRADVRAWCSTRPACCRISTRAC